MIAYHGDDESSGSLPRRFVRREIGEHAPTLEAFVTAISAGLCGVVGLLLGGYGEHLVRLQRPDSNT